MRRIIAFILCAIMCLALISSAYAADDPIVIGTTITLGEYEQDNNLGNGTEPIQWIVLDIQDGKALILSKYLIDTIMYNNKATYITWENCSLRNWLNNDFLSTAFDGEAQNSILLTNVKNDMGQGLDGLSVDGGNDTEDHIFLLSFQEVLQYFKTDTLRIAFPTDYAASLYGTPTWYTRSPGETLPALSSSMPTETRGKDMWIIRTHSRASTPGKEFGLQCGLISIWFRNLRASPYVRTNSMNFRTWKTVWQL